MAKKQTKRASNAGKKSPRSSSGTNSKTKSSIIMEERNPESRVKTVIIGLIYIAIGAFLFAAMQFKTTGQFGDSLGIILKGIFGHIALVLPWYLIILGVLLVSQKTMRFSKKTIIITIIVLLLLCLVNSGRFINAADVNYDLANAFNGGRNLSGGGVFGMVVGALLVELIGKTGLYLLAIVLIVICLIILFKSPISKLLDNRAERREEKKLQKKNKKDELYLVDDDILPDYDNKKKTVAEYKPVTSNYIPKISGIEAYDDYDEPYMSLSENLKNDNFSENIFDMYGIDDKASNSAGSNVVDFMNENYPFGEGQGSDGYGIDPARESAYGMGLDGKPESSEGYGLNGDLDKTEEYIPKDDIIKPFDNFGDDIAIGAAAGLGTVAAATAVASKVNKNNDVASSDIIIKPNDGNEIKAYQKPPVDLLKLPKHSGHKGMNEVLKQKAKMLEDTLKSFGVDAKVVQVTQGPTVTRFEIQPNVGVKVSKIVNLSDDIALNLRAKSIRIEAPIPGKNAIGIEVENDNTIMVTAREIIDSREFRNAKSKISFAVGKDIAGNNIVADLKGMPHLLIAGSTGSGKSVCINTIITSILYKANPDEVKLILVDPKVVELGNYNGIPHLLIPVVTEPTKAAAALNWAVAEMTNRYKLFADNGVRDLESFNRLMKREHKEDQIIPQIVIIIDELADLMMAAAKQVEASICRLAQLARAAGMHLIIATQRPSVDVITGLIKANMPSRIAFAVTSQVDSRTILDMGGAEKLVGKGDMLFAPSGTKPVRVQGPYISDDEINAVIDFVKAQNVQETYSDDAIQNIENGGVSSDLDDADELLPDAIECVVVEGHASTSMLQRRFRIGYNRAARMMDEMEERGIIGPQDGSRPRQVLMTEEELDKLKN